MKQVTVYSTPYCGYCRRAKALLKSLDIPFVEIDLASSQELRDELVAKYHWQTVPLILFGDKFIGGYDNLAELAQSGKVRDLLID